MKVVSPNIIHKTDLGGVKLNLASSQEIEDAYELYHPEAIIYLFVILVIFYVGKKVYDVLTPYNLN